jgi:hypothetical protein
MPLQSPAYVTAERDRLERGSPARSRIVGSRKELQLPAPADVGAACIDPQRALSSRTHSTCAADGD